MKKDIKWEVEWQIKWLAAHKEPNSENIKETSKKFIEYMLSGILRRPYKVLKRNPGHITLCEVSKMPGPDIQEIASRLCREKIVFVPMDEIQAIKDREKKFRKEDEKTKRKKLNGKVKRRKE
jgi:hypothetical protein